MQQYGILILIIVVVIGVFAVALFLNSRTRAADASMPKLPLSEKAKAIFKSNDPSTRSPAGSMAARREDIEDLLRGKEDHPG